MTIDTSTEAVERAAGFHDDITADLLRALAAERDALKDELRVRFAGLAMQGLCASPDTGKATHKDIAMDAVTAADALITELLKEKRHGIDP